MPAAAPARRCAMSRGDLGVVAGPARPSTCAGSPASVTVRVTTPTSGRRKYSRHASASAPSCTATSASIVVGRVAVGRADQQRVPAVLPRERLGGRGRPAGERGDAPPLGGAGTRWRAGCTRAGAHGRRRRAPGGRCAPVRGPRCAPSSSASCTIPPPGRRTVVGPRPFSALAAPRWQSVAMTCPRRGHGPSSPRASRRRLPDHELGGQQRGPDLRRRAGRHPGRAASARRTGRALPAAPPPWSARASTARRRRCCRTRRRSRPAAPAPPPPARPRISPIATRSL